MVFAQKPAKLKAAMAEVLENADNALTPMMRNMIGILWDEWKTVEAADRRTDRQARTDRHQRCRLLPHPTDPRHRPHRRDGHRGRYRQRRGVPQGTRLCGMARPRAATVLDWWQGEAIGHQQAWQHLPAQDSDSRRTRCGDAHKTRSLSDRSMDERARSAELHATSWSLRWRTSSHVSHGLYSQPEKTTGPRRAWQQHEIERKRRLRLGSAPRSHFPALRRRLYQPRSAQESKDERTVKTAYLKPVSDNGLNDRSAC